ncbi:MAG: hypothetical protein FRX48_03648 [Lasallia pustulata]|uniref:Uncharacterized protein n=1 Tax=Lasallia pustulata TaxID=136370 RepID=A0A5M8PSV4_9LECA|nr:MAG: hypothetical protein FRX48_03648 [Lasallia pustulata]
MYIRHAGATPIPRVRIISDREKAHPLLEAALIPNLQVKVLDNRDPERGGARVHPILAQLVAMPCVDRLHRVAQVVEHAGEGLKGPAGAAEGFPDPAVVREGPEGDERVVRGAAAEDFGARVADVGVSCEEVNGVS